MDIKIKPAKLFGQIEAMPSKSHAQRLLIAAALADKPTKILIKRRSKDIDAAIMAISSLGAKVDKSSDHLLVTPSKPHENPEVFCNESGTTARIILPVIAAVCERGTLTGAGSLLGRPFSTLCDVMQQHGCHFDCKTLPISFHGRLQSGTYSIRGDESSQYISGLMFALPLLDGPSKIVLTTPLQSVGYIELTSEVLRLFGLRGGFETPGNETYQSPGEVAVDGDWSNAAFWLAAGVQVTGLNPNSKQKDSLFSKVKDSSEIDAGDIPDLVPILSVYAAVSGKTVRIHNAERLKIKESNRLETVHQMLTSLGAKADITDDGLIIYGKGRLSGGIVDGCNDHRIVMSAAIASIFCDGEVIIKGAQAAAKSYPEFFTDFNTLGGDAHVVDVR